MIMNELDLSRFRNIKIDPVNFRTPIQIDSIYDIRHTRSITRIKLPHEKTLF